MVFFGSSSSSIPSPQVTSRVETMRAAEWTLMSFAKKFIGPFSSPNPDDYDIDTFDTPIPRSVVPLVRRKSRNCGGGAGGLSSSCQMFPGSRTKMEAEGDEEEEDMLIMHGVKVQSKGGATTSGTSSNSTAPLVLLHGYANGALYFYRNLYGLCSSQTFSSVYALDLLGWGLSSRPTFQLEDSWKKGDDDKDQSSSSSSSVEIAEDFFCESLEAWRKHHQIDKMTLGGHSMGGYLSVAYAERYPERVDRLILISPVGVPHNDGDHEVSPNTPLRFRLMFNLVKMMWSRGVTPGQFLRTFSESRGRGMVESYVERRLPAIQDVQEREVLTEYLYTNAALPASGEYCLSHLLKPVAYAHKPTVFRIPNLKVSHVSFIYGEKDWMDVTGGLQVQKACRERQQQGGGASSLSSPTVDVHVVKNAGHLLMLDNWREFNSAMMLSAGFGPRLGLLGSGSSLYSHVPRPETIDVDATTRDMGVSVGAA